MLIGLLDNTCSKFLGSQSAGDIWLARPMVSGYLINGRA